MNLQEARDARERKIVGGHVTEVKQSQRNGVPVGIVEGYIATWDIDEGLDRFQPGAFAESLVDHASRGNRPVRLKDHHWETVGGFPLAGVREDPIGLFGSGEIVLSTAAGTGLYDMARADYLSDFSVGFSALETTLEQDGEVRVIEKATLWEGSIVDEPMNQAARITGVKSAQYASLPFARAAQRWEGDDEGIDVVHKGHVVPQRLHAVALDIIAGKKEASQDQVMELERVFAQMGQDSPFPAELRGFVSVDEARKASAREIQDYLRRGTVFGKGAARLIADRLTSKSDAHIEPVASIMGVPTRDLIDEMQGFAHRLG